MYKLLLVYHLPDERLFPCPSSRFSFSSTGPDSFLKSDGQLSLAVTKLSMSIFAVVIIMKSFITSSNGSTLKNRSNLTSLDHFSPEKSNATEITFLISADFHLCLIIF